MADDTTSTDPSASADELPVSEETDDAAVDGETAAAATEEEEEEELTAADIFSTATFTKYYVMVPLIESNNLIVPIPSTSAVYSGTSNDTPT